MSQRYDPKAIEAAIAQALALGELEDRLRASMAAVVARRDQAGTIRRRPRPPSGNYIPLKEVPKI